MENPYNGAAAYIRGNGANSGLRGTVTFLPHGENVLVTAQVEGFPKSESGFFALHIHEGDSCRGEGFPHTGGHYNPHNTPHPMHAGDLPPLLSCGGRAWMSVLTNRFQIQDILGRTVVIHSGPDDFRTQPAGNSGEKIGCGRIYPSW